VQECLCVVPCPPGIIVPFVWCTPTCASFPSLLFFDAAAACRSAVLRFCSFICICSFVWCTPTCASFPSLLFFDAAAACRSAVLFSFEYSRAFCLPARS
jgi:hypothetical protein